MACGEFGPGRMAEPPEILAAIDAALAARHRSPAGTSLVTSGPTHEPIDPVRYIANRSSGRQGSAIAEALARRGARVTFVTGPAEAPRPRGAAVVEVETAARDARRRRGGAARRRRRLRRRRRRLARDLGQRLQGQEGPPPGSPRRSRWPRTPTSSAPSPPAPTARAWSSASPPRPTTSSPTPPPSGCARAPTGSSPTTSRPATGIMGGTENAVTLSPPRAPSPGRACRRPPPPRRLADRIAEALA